MANNQVSWRLKGWPNPLVRQRQSQTNPFLVDREHKLEHKASKGSVLHKRRQSYIRWFLWLVCCGAFFGCCGEKTETYSVVGWKETVEIDSASVFAIFHPDGSIDTLDIMQYDTTYVYIPIKHTVWDDSLNQPDTIVIPLSRKGASKKVIRE